MPNTELFAEDAFIVDPNKNYLEELVGDGKKFQTPEELARGKAESDAFIARLQREQDELRTELNTRIKYEDFLDKLERTPQGSNPGPQDQDEPPKDMSAMTPDELERLLEQKLNQREQQRSATQNLNVVKAKLLETYGPNYAQHLKRQAAELGETEEFLQTLAQRNPQALFKLLGVGETKRDNLFDAPPRTEVTGTRSTSQGRGDSYFENIRKTSPELYFTPKIQNEIFDRIKEMGAEKFYSS